MKYVFRFTGLVIAAAALLFAGCSKKPRPNPSQTVFGQGGDQLNASGIDAGLTDTSAAGLESRDWTTDPANQDRETLKPMTVFFDFDSASIRGGERAKLTQAANYLKSNPSARMFLEGHCDWRGTTEYNMGLGDRRARAVKDFLATLGVTVDGIDTVSKGDLDAKEGATATEMQQDRRVEFVLAKQ